jgi:hypothetical protein
VEPQYRDNLLELGLEVQQDLTDQRDVHFNLEGEVDGVACSQVDVGERGKLLNRVGVVGKGFADGQRQLQLGLGQGVGLQLQRQIGRIQVADSDCLALALTVGLLVPEVDGGQLAAPIFSAHMAADQSVIVSHDFEGNEHASSEFHNSSKPERRHV